MNILNFSTAHLKQNLLAALMLGLTAVLAPPGAMAEPGNATKRETNSIVRALEQRGYSATFAREIEQILSENRALIARGEIPNTPDYTFSIEFISPIHDANGMEALVKGGSALPRMDEKALGLPAVLDESTLEATCDRLFGASETNENGSATAKERCLKQFNKLKAQPNGADAIATFFSLYNDGKQTITYPSRESYGQLFKVSRSIAQFLARSPEERKKQFENISIFDYMLLTDPRADSLLKLHIGMNYFCFSPQALGKHPILKKLPAIGELQDIAETAPARIRNISKPITELAQKEGALAQKEGALAQKEGALAQKEGALAQEKKELAQHKAVTAQIGDFGRIAGEIESISTWLIERMKLYKTKPSVELKKEIDAKIAAMQELQRQVQVYGESEVFVQGCKTCLEFIATVEELIRVIQFVYSQNVEKRN